MAETSAKRVSEKVLFWGAVALAALIHAAAAMTLPITWHNDAMAYSRQAAQLLGMVAGGPADSFFPPGYPAFLSVGRLIGGEYALHLIVAVQHLLCVLMIIVIVGIDVPHVVGRSTF